MQKNLFRVYPKSMRRIQKIVINASLYKKYKESDIHKNINGCSLVLGYMFKSVEMLIDDIFEEKMFVYENEIATPRSIIDIINIILERVSIAYPSRHDDFVFCIDILRKNRDFLIGLCEETMERNHGIFMYNRRKMNYNLLLMIVCLKLSVFWGYLFTQ